MLLKVEISYAELCHITHIKGFRVHNVWTGNTL